MRVLVLEAVTAGLCGEVEESLRREGRVMRDAARELILAAGADRVFTPESQDVRLAATARERSASECDPALTRRATRTAPIRSRLNGVFAGDADAAFVIAPETDGMLAELLDATEAAGLPTPGNCTPADASRFGDKQECHDALRGVVASVPTATRERLSELPTADRYVVKPRDGAGSGFRFADERYAGGGDVCQPFLRGESMSVGVLNGRPLYASRQHIEVDGNGGRYVGGESAVLTPQIAAFAAAATRGVRGFVGIDLMQTPDGPVLLEVNPRLTTSAAMLLPGDGSVDLLGGSVTDEFRPRTGSWQVEEFAT